MRGRFLLALAVLWPASALALPITYTATLSGVDESPPNASPGSGSATITIDTTAHTLFLDVAFSGLLGTTTAAHIHCCSTPNAGVATTTPSFPGFPLGVTSGSYTQTFDLTQASSWNPAFVAAEGSIAGAEAALAAGLADGVAYLNIHTDVVPGGEIRGFATTPEPSVVMLLAAGLASLSLARRRA
jgi:hypothetical protein